MATDAARTTRLAALLAGQGFVFVKLFDLVMANGNFRWGNGLMTLAPIMGMSLAYTVLRRKADRISQQFELTSIWVLAHSAAAPES